MSASQSADRPVQRRMVYEGRVQGVGFRYTCAKIAKRYQVGGYVKNLANGQVELEAAGSANAVEQFLAEVAETFLGNIERTSASEVDRADMPGEFRILH